MKEELLRLVVAYWCLTIIVILAELYEQTPKRLPNKKRNRQHAIDKLGEFSDFEFKRQTGLSRNMFNYVLGLIRPKLQFLLRFRTSIVTSWQLKFVPHANKCIGYRRKPRGL